MIKLFLAIFLLGAQSLFCAAAAAGAGATNVSAGGAPGEAATSTGSAGTAVGTKEKPYEPTLEDFALQDILLEPDIPETPLVGIIELLGSWKPFDKKIIDNCNKLPLWRKYEIIWMVKAKTRRCPRTIMCQKALLRILEKIITEHETPDLTTKKTAIEALGKAILGLTKKDAEMFIARKIEALYPYSSPAEKSEYATFWNIEGGKDLFVQLHRTNSGLETSKSIDEGLCKLYLCRRFPKLSDAQIDVRAHFIVQYYLVNYTKENYAKWFFDSDEFIALLRANGLDPEAEKRLQDALTAEQSAHAATTHAKEAALASLAAEHAAREAAERAREGLTACLAREKTTCATLTDEKAHALALIAQEQSAHEATSRARDTLRDALAQEREARETAERALATCSEELSLEQTAHAATQHERAIAFSLLDEEKSAHTSTLQAKSVLEDALAAEQAARAAADEKRATLQREKDLLSEQEEALRSGLLQEKSAREAAEEGAAALLTALAEKEAALTAAEKESDIRGRMVAIITQRHKALLAQSTAASTVTAFTQTEPLPSWAIAWSPTSWHAPAEAVWLPWLFFMSFWGSGYADTETWACDIAAACKLPAVRDFLQKWVIPQKILETPAYRKVATALFTACMIMGGRAFVEVCSGKAYPFFHADVTGSRTSYSPHFDNLIHAGCIGSFMWWAGKELFTPVDPNMRKTPSSKPYRPLH